MLQCNDLCKLRLALVLTKYSRDAERRKFIPFILERPKREHPTIEVEVERVRFI